MLVLPQTEPVFLKISLYSYQNYTAKLITDSVSRKVSPLFPNSLSPKCHFHLNFYLDPLMSLLELFQFSFSSS